MKALLIAGILLGSLPLRGQVQLYKLPEPKGPVRVKLVPLGDVPAADVYVVKRALEDYYLAIVTVTAPLVIPPKVGVNGRSRSIRIKNGRKQVVTDSTNLQDIMIGYLIHRKEKEFDKVVGITTYGITLEKDKWSIRGITDAASSCSVVSTYLVRQQSATAEEYQFRLAKVALHEFGHVLGLLHCGEDPASGVQGGEYSDKRSTVALGNPRCFMLQSTPDGAQIYATTNQIDVRPVPGEGKGKTQVTILQRQVKRF